MTATGMVRDKVVLVTGAGRGIGRAMAELLAAHGAKLVVNDRGGSEKGEGADRTPAMETVAAIREAGGEAIVNADSVADFDAAEAMVRQAVEAYGRIDAVINNAGILRDVIFHKMTEADWDAVIAVHLKGSFNVSRAAATRFRAQRSGAFVHMTSTSGLIGSVGQANYAAAKLAMVGLSKSLALDMARFNVRSNCIAPSAWSRMIGTIPINSEAQRARIENLKTMTPAKIAPVAVFLVSDAAAGVSGQIFAVRKNEIFVMRQWRPVRAVHDGAGWTPEAVADVAMPALRSGFTGPERTRDVFSWDSI